MERSEIRDDGKVGRCPRISLALNPGDEV